MDKKLHTSERRRLVDLLRRMRTEAGLTQVELGDRLGRPQSFVSKYESGERRLDLIELDAICVALGTDLAALVRRYSARS